MEENKLEVPEMNEEQKKDFLKIILKRALEESKTENVDIPKKIETLKQLKELYDRKTDFKKGDIIKWKGQLKNRKLPEYNEPVIILEILENVIYNSDEQIGSTYFNEPMDIKVGIIKDNSFLTFHFDSSRFELYE
jgi:hypothetical protein